MPETVNQACIFVPMLVVVALTFVAFFAMGAARAGAIKAGVNPDFYRAQIGDSEPEAIRSKVRHYNNLLEAPVLFYAACLTAFVLGSVSQWTVWFAWGFVVLRVVQSFVHLTYNNPAHRGLAFALGMLFVLAMWVNIGIEIAARI
jgi:hypothetical protein